MRVAVVGAGSWGTAVASIAAANNDVTLWARRPQLAQSIASNRENPDYLPGQPLPPMETTSDLPIALRGADVLVMAVPSHGFRTVLEQAASSVPADLPIISLTKGIEQHSHLRMTQVVAEVLPDHDVRRIGVLSGPNLAREVVLGQPAATVIAMRDRDISKLLQPVFMTPTFRVYTNPDVVGAETAGALKNVMAIAAGIVRGLEFGMNTLATLITRALAELTRLGVAMGGHPLTFGGLAGVGDLMATCSSPDSRNNRVGFELGKGRRLDDIIAEMNMVAEGVKTTSAVLEIADAHRIEMPIAAAVGRVLHEDEDPRAAIATLMTREAKAEGHGIVP